MLNSPYVYQIELYTQEGTAIGKAPLAIDWEPAREWTRFASVRAGRIAANALEDVATAHPVWHPRAGEPYVEGFRIAMTIGDEEVTSAFGTEYFAPLAREALAAMREQTDQLASPKPAPAGRAGEGGDTTVRYVTTAYPATKTPSGSVARGFVTREVAVDLVLRDTTLDGFAAGAVAHGESVDGEMPVFIPQLVLNEAAMLTSAAGARETGGILIGHLHRDPCAVDVFAEVTAQIPARHTEADATSLTFTAATWTDVRRALALRARDELMLGWWHSHPVREWCKSCPPEKQRTCSLGAGFLSAHDRALHRTVFPRAYSLALVASDVAIGQPTFAMFGWQHGVLAKRGFNVVSRISS